MKEKYFIGICGNYGKDGNAHNGQTVKTKILTEALKERYPEATFLELNTSDWRKNPVQIVLGCLKLLKNCKNVIILPAQAAVRIIVPLLTMLNRFFGRKIHYYVVGGWIGETLDKHPGLKKSMEKLDGIYVELHSMEYMLRERDFENVVYVNKFRKMTPISATELVTGAQEPYRLCFFSRVHKEKGVEEAIAAVAAVNEALGRRVFELDLFGQIDADYAERFAEVVKSLPDGVQYGGVVDFEKSTQVLKQYFAMVFPTYYSGEGYANTVVDAFAAGLPVIATDWKYNAEVITDGEDGMLYYWENPEKLRDILLEIAKAPEKIIAMKSKALARAGEYDPQQAIKPLIRRLE